MKDLAAGIEENAALCLATKIAAGEDLVEEGRISTADANTEISLSQSDVTSNVAIYQPDLEVLSNAGCNVDANLIGKR